MKFDKVMMETAQIWANMSYCKRLKVGAVLSSQDGRILATGYNGTLHRYINICEEFESTSAISTETMVCPKCKGSGKLNYQNHIYIKPTICDICKGKGNIKLLNKTSEYTLHAEQNIIAYCAKNGISMKDTILYITHSPCKQCAKLIIQSGVKEIVYKDEYRDTNVIQFLQQFIKVRKYDSR